MSARPCFTIDNALQQLLLQDHEEFHGEPHDASGSDEDSADNDRADDEIGEINGDNHEHFLSATIEAAAAALRYVSDDGQMEQSEASATGELVNSATEGAANLDRTPDKICCGCSQNCLQKFENRDIEVNILNMKEMDRHESDLIILAHLDSCRHQYTLAHKPGEKRRRDRFGYSFQGVDVCVGAFKHIYDVGEKRLRNLRKHLDQHGVSVRTHGNAGRRPHNSLFYTDVERVVEFIHHHAEIFGIPHPAPLHGRDGLPPVFLPASQTYKHIHSEYVAVCKHENWKAVGETSFRDIWHRCLPQIKFMTACMDVCSTCEALRRKILNAVGEAKKLEACQHLADHISEAQRERDLYKQRTVDARGRVG